LYSRSVCAGSFWVQYYGLAPPFLPQLPRNRTQPRISHRHISTVLRILTYNQKLDDQSVHVIREPRSLKRGSPSSAPFQVSVPFVMANSMPYISPEIILMILAISDLELTDLLRCTSVNKQWHSLIYNSNTLRARLFLSPRSASGELVAVTDPYTKYLCASIEPYSFHPIYLEPYHESGLDCEFSDNITLHPLLVEHRAEQPDLCTDFILDTDVLEDLLRKNHGSVTSSWHGMCVTEPPTSEIGLRVFSIRCDGGPSSDTDSTYRVEKELKNPTGVTLKEVFDAMWETTLPRNMGLIEDAGNCVDTILDTGESECTCYHILDM
jgi:hypothetical protein